MLFLCKFFFLDDIRVVGCEFVVLRVLVLEFMLFCVLYMGFLILYDVVDRVLLFFMFDMEFLCFGNKVFIL